MFRDSIRANSASLYLRNEETGDFVLVASVEYPEVLTTNLAYRSVGGLTAWVAKAGKPLMVNSPDEVNAHPSHVGKWDNVQWNNPLFQNVLAVPLKSRDDTTIGILKAENKIADDHGFSQVDISIGESFARTAAIALELRQKNIQLRRFIYAFVLMPFDSSFNDIYQYGLKRPIEELGITCERVDEIQYVGGVLDQVFKCIESARFIVADMTGRNPNVFYEVGYCHAIKKDVILCTQSTEDIPFDLRGYNHIVYEKKIAFLEETLRLPT